ncbi:MAG: hypothetical protein IH607_07310, partial [Firmicutes bacterium]|nr:hypothetical protein [Bacillota bacterium]
MRRMLRSKDVSSTTWRNMTPTRDVILWAIDLGLYVVIATCMLFLSEAGIYPIGYRLLSLLLLIAFVFTSRWVFNVYRQVWRYATGHEYLAVIWADFVGGVAYVLFSFLLSRWNMQIMV